MKNLLSTTNIRRTAAALGLALGIGMSIGAPASADEPIAYTRSWSFDQMNPCTNKPIELTINAEHVDRVGHPNNFVGHASRTGTSDSGYVMDHSVANFQVNGNMLHEGFSDIWRHPDGSAFRAQGNLVVDIRTGDAKVNRFGVRCLGS